MPNEKMKPQSKKQNWTLEVTFDSKEKAQKVLNIIDLILDIKQWIIREGGVTLPYGKK